jgi:Notch-like protein
MYKNDGTCTTKANGGCVTRTTCDSVTIEAACLRNNINEDCYWRGEECVDKICENAPLKYNTNQ